jgi:glycosyltransferase involved in cell wall biosynthesis
VAVVPELEPFGLTVLEALASGTPVVAVREGGPREVVRDGHDGVLVEPTPHAVANGIRRVLEGPDAYPAARLRADVEAGEWSWEHFARRIEAILGDVAHSASG